jgi:hypothetical protein
MNWGGASEICQGQAGKRPAFAGQEDFRICPGDSSTIPNRGGGRQRARLRRATSKTSRCNYRALYLLFNWSDNSGGPAEGVFETECVRLLRQPRLTSRFNCCNAFRSAIAQVCTLDQRSHAFQAYAFLDEQERAKQSLWSNEI